MQKASVLPDGRIGKPGRDGASVGHVHIPQLLPVLPDWVIPEARHDGPTAMDQEVEAVGPVGP